MDKVNKFTFRLNDQEWLTHPADMEPAFQGCVLAPQFKRDPLAPPHTVLVHLISRTLGAEEGNCVGGDTISASSGPALKNQVSER